MDPELYGTEEQKSGSGSQIIEFIQTLVVFAAIGTVIYLFVAQPHKVQGPSMFPTFKDGDYIITDKISYYFGAPKRGDVIVFHYPRNHALEYIKRIVGVPGDKVKVADNKVFVNGAQLTEDYLPPETVTRAGFEMTLGKELTVPEGQYLVFGDNREHSSDSREWGFVKKEEFAGRVFVRYWPANAVGFFPGAVK